MTITFLAHAIINKLHEKSHFLIMNIYLWLGKCSKYEIVSDATIGSIVDIFKPKTKETIKLMRTFGFIENGSFDVTYPAINLSSFENAIVEGKTDYVIVDHKIYWPKFFNYNFSKNITRDYGFFGYKDDVIVIRTPKVSRTFNLAFSLLGVHAHVWSHSLSEYFTKLIEIKKILSLEKEELVVLCPNYTDLQLKQIIYDYLSKFDRVKIVSVSDGECVKVKKLYYMQRPASFTDHETYVAIGDNLQPKIVADIIKKELVIPMTKGMEDSSYPKKLYLPRRGTYRSLTNNTEVEDYFKSQGYFFLEPHKVSLEEKIKYFYNAEKIAGSYSSAFSNLIFSKPDTKALLFSNYQRIFESWLSMHYQHFGIDMMFVTGIDLKKENSAHSSFYIPLDKIKAACKYLGL